VVRRAWNALSFWQRVGIVIFEIGFGVQVAMLVYLAFGL
jgi:hypothetical protein